MNRLRRWLRSRGSDGVLFIIMLLVLALTLLALLASVVLAAENGILREDQTKSEVLESLGRPPDKTQFQLCGSNTAHAWPCKIWTYAATNGDLLAIFFRYDEGEWRVNSWRMRYRSR